MNRLSSTEYLVVTDPLRCISRAVSPSGRRRTRWCPCTRCPCTRVPDGPDMPICSLARSLLSLHLFFFWAALRLILCHTESRNAVGAIETAPSNLVPPRRPPQHCTRARTRVPVSPRFDLTNP
ncbi:hypothetical protein IF2G_07381 [Cordyceps javanica]|nr:hypothetical protein IF2G_07381 [Cordyceps javanica]